MRVMIGGLSQKNHSWIARGWFIGKFMAVFFWIPQYITPEQPSKPLRKYM